MWAVAQGAGTITQSGLYTAPSAVETDVVVATSQADTSKSASASLTVAAPHSVSLSWIASSSPGVSYKVYRGTVSGGPYTPLASGMSATSYTDTSVQSGNTYYYVTTAVDSSGESGYSNEAQVVVPIP
jgi:cellulose 1,4-beta-cellobiosidase